MKRFLLCAMICIMSVSASDAQEGKPDAEGAQKNFFALFWDAFVDGLITPQVHKPFSVMAGMEGSRNERAGFLPVVYAAGDYEFSRYISFGVRGGLTFGSRQPEDSLVTVMEGAVYGRVYLWDWGFIRPFIQTGIGISLNREKEYEYMDILGEVASGVRMHWKGWFVENSIRFGYPFVMGFGVNIGHSFLP